MINIDQSLLTYYSVPILFNSTNPVDNLTLEQCVFEQYEPGHPSVLLFYFNSCSVIVGKHQNPWYEADVQWLEQEQIPLIRRMSGGGTVVHDLGNLNYSFLCDKKDFNQRANLEFLKYILNSLGVTELDITDRGDLLLKGYKISGNAMWYKKETVMHHGTLLFASDLSRLKRALLGMKYLPNLQFEGHWVDSKPWKVGNIQDFYDHVDPNAMISLVKELLGSQHKKLSCGIQGFCKYEPSEKYLTDLTKSDRYAELLNQYKSWEWNFAKTPKFQCRNSEDNQQEWLVINQGMIQNQGSNNLNLDRFLGLPSLNRVFFKG
jgi:lipoate-protein ligase A